MNFVLLVNISPILTSVTAEPVLSTLTASHCNYAATLIADFITANKTASVFYSNSQNFAILFRVACLVMTILANFFTLTQKTVSRIQSASCVCSLQVCA